MTAVTHNGRALKYASDELRSDREVVMSAVSCDAWALEFASDELRNDRKVVLVALKNDKKVIEWASNELQNDKWIRGYVSDVPNHNFKMLVKMYMKFVRFDNVYKEFMHPDNPRMAKYIEHIGDDDAERYLPTMPPYVEQILKKRKIVNL